MLHLLDAQLKLANPEHERKCIIRHKLKPNHFLVKLPRLVRVRRGSK